MAISSSGILATLGHLIRSEPKVLQQASVEFLQCCLLAEQYRYAARLIDGTWPRPTGWPRPIEVVSVKQVLRYYYLRGMIHLGCNDLDLAHRCFWTCLCIPAEVCSKIAIEAWKKLVLVQCLLHDGSAGSSGITLPKSMPNCLARAFASFLEENPLARQQQQFLQQQQQEQQQQFASFPRQQPPLPQQYQQQQQNQGRMTQSQSTTNPIACYKHLAKAFFDRDKVSMERLERENMTTFTEDGNLGLVHQCQSHLVNCQVAHLARMYSVVPLSKIAQTLGVEDESQMIAILCRSKVPCQIADNGMVQFDDTDGRMISTTTATTTSATKSLASISEWMQLMEKVQKLDVAIATNSKYHALMRKDTSAEKTAATGPRGVEDV